MPDLKSYSTVEILEQLVLLRTLIDHVYIDELGKLWFAQQEELLAEVAYRLYTPGRHVMDDYQVIQEELVILCEGSVQEQAQRALDNIPAALR